MSVWFDIADAVITVYTVESAFEIDEERQVLTQIPFSNSDKVHSVTFRKKVFDVLAALSEVYADFDHVHISIDVVFRHEYVNA
jgi:hypothetical protein